MSVLGCKPCVEMVVNGRVRNPYEPHQDNCLYRHGWSDGQKELGRASDLMGLAEVVEDSLRQLSSEAELGIDQLDVKDALRTAQKKGWVFLHEDQATTFTKDDVDDAMADARPAVLDGGALTIVSGRMAGKSFLLEELKDGAGIGDGSIRITFGAEGGS